MRNALTVRGVILCALISFLPGLDQLAMASDDSPAPRITVTGEGNADIAPDMAILVLSVNREAVTAREALTANSTAMSKVLDAMLKLGIAKRDLQTANFNIQPRYSYPNHQGNGPGEAPKLVGYTVTNSLSVRVRDINRVGEVLDTAVTLGVNEGGSIVFTNDDPSAAITQARVKAVQDALAKARTLADAAGVKTGRVLEMSEQSYSPGPVPMMAQMEMSSMKMSAADAAPIAAGENTYKVMVNISLAIAE